MIRKWFHLLACVLFICFTIGCTTQKEAPPLVTGQSGEKNTPYPGGAPDPKSEILPFYPTYIATINLDPKQRSASTIETIRYKNTSRETLDQLIVRTYGNMESAESIPPFYIEKVLNNTTPGEAAQNILLIDSLLVDGKANTTYVLDGTVLQIPLQSPLKTGEEIEITLQFHCTIPNGGFPFGIGEKSAWFGNFLPVMAIYDSNGWNQDPYYPLGDTVYSAISNFEVTLIAPEEYEAVYTGTGTTSEREGRKVTQITASMVRDFAFAVSNSYKKDSIETDDGISIRFYHTTENITETRALLESIKKSMEYYVQKVGSYPYQKIDIVEYPSSIGGSAHFSQLIFWDPQQPLVQERNSIGQQWFNGIIGVNRSQYGWLHNGLNFFTQRYILEGPETIDASMEALFQDLQNRAQFVQSPVLQSPLSAYASWEEYDWNQDRSECMMYYLYKKLGTRKFELLLQTYYNKFSFQNVTANDFFNLASDLYGKSLNGFFKSWTAQEELPSVAE